eukprot:TRINITY_DN1481_c0_g2_i2.p1 TRINITY_DN1481_c0_g2~~TRINITY_DN1481_c0_g2_i2.p1  ORF type:complete len:210 (-),score=51.76 TRINITY_DN1481_c0_g2_i2:205-834(-)
MCIRDRVSTQSTWGIIVKQNNKNKMQKALIFLALLFAAGSTQNWGADFLRGIHEGMGVTANPYILPLITNTSLNFTGINNGFTNIQYAPSQYKEAAINQFRDSFYNFSLGLYNVLKQDANFSIVLNYTLTVFASPQIFAQRASIFQTRTGRNPYLDIAQLAGGPYFNKDYFNAGINLGLIVNTLQQVTNSTNSTLVLPQRPSLIGLRKD